VERDGRISLSSLESLLKTKSIAHPVKSKVEIWDQIDSTNTRAIALGKEGAACGMLVIAREQTAGRGRLGRQWTSPPDSGIYASFLLRPPIAQMDKLSAITLGAGVAVAEAVEKATGIRVGLKWVNDLVLDGKKLGGILAEMSTKDGIVSLVIGIGINVAMDAAEVPEELQNRMTWLEAATRNPVDANLVLAELCLSLERVYNAMLDNKAESILDEWRMRSVTLGKQVRATSGTNEFEGTARDITQSGSLLLRLASGEEKELHAGEITIRSADGSYC
jgi:BirA family biotin operon repressor/biotin-[acetyl-CoA-carboxylase] ligase